jgi:hypothetical protein
VRPVVDVVDCHDADLDEFLAPTEAGAHGGVAGGAFEPGLRPLRMQSRS